MGPLKHYLKICKHYVFPNWHLVVWLSLVTAPGYEPTWNIFLPETVCKGAGKTACLLMWAPYHGSIGIRWKWGVNFTFRPLCPWGKLHWSHWIVKCNDRRVSLSAVEKTQSLAFLGNWTRICPSSSPWPNRYITLLIAALERLHMCATVYVQCICVLRSTKETGFCLGCVLKINGTYSFSCRKSSIWLLPPYNYKIMFLCYML